MGWLFLAGAIGAEVAGTLALRSVAAEFRWGPAAVVAVGYLVSFALLALALLIYGERISLLGVFGMVLIVAGVGVVSLSGSG